MIKELREKVGLTQSQAAKRLKLNVGFWSRVEAGKCALPPKRYGRVAKLLRTSCKALIAHRTATFEQELSKDVYRR